MELEALESRQPEGDDCINAIFPWLARASTLELRRWQECPYQIPVPRGATNVDTGVLERFELQASFGEPHYATILQQALAVGGYQMRHGLAAPDVPVQPEPTVHGVDHTVATSRKLSIDCSRGGRA